MQTIQSGRRIFLSNLAILTAGTVWGSAVSSLFPNNRIKTGLASTWQALCTRYHGSPGNIVLKVKKELPACKGHTYRQGPTIYFPEEKIWAEPVWIYWANHKDPSDLVVHFYKPDAAAITLNRYELEALLRPGNTSPESRIPPLTTFLKINENGLRAPIVQTAVYNNKIKTVYIA